MIVIINNIKLTDYFVINLTGGSNAPLSKWWQNEPKKKYQVNHYHRVIIAKTLIKLNQTENDCVF